MAQIINTNISALTAQRNLNKSQSALQTNMQRLSSGLRINSAKDDAAGLAISNRFQSQINGLNQASRNANDGISLAQTGEGALEEVTNALQRMRTLAVQAANDTNSVSDRQALQLEVRQLVDEINRIGNTTEFNSKKLLSGEDSEFSFQIGAGPGQMLAVKMGDMRASALGQQPGAVQTVGHRIDLGAGGYVGIAKTADAVAEDTSFIAFGDFKIEVAGYNEVDIADARYGGHIALRSSGDITDTTGLNYGAGIAKDIADRINSIREGNYTGTDGKVVLEGVYAAAETRFSVLSAASGDINSDGQITAPFSNVGAGSITYDGLVVNGVDMGPAVFQKNDADGSLVNQINSKSNLTGVTASINKDGALEFYAEDGRDIVIETKSGEASNLLFAGGGAAVHDNAEANFAAGAGGAVSLRIAGNVTISAQQTITMTADKGFDKNLVAGDDFAIGEGMQDNVQATGTIQSADVTTVQGANTLMRSVDSALEQVDGLRAVLGAVQNRFEMTIRNLDNVAENLSAANSRIRDADFAAETTAMTRNQILQQAGTAILSQANAQAQNVLSLLQG
ncbi:flagellin [Methylotuvimicrobium buryatense]|uniref:Flagellin n=1 Tax=Methylotuvimicrobium buryatense TaxID=95641 RepID=A0A4P9UVW6_METBY|nr:flagellin [Methylotuvimicrobium buryatense]QCW83866.1 flagellin [Methylotuvimicrobium buryatense]